MKKLKMNKRIKEEGIKIKALFLFVYKDTQCLTCIFYFTLGAAFGIIQLYFYKIQRNSNRIGVFSYEQEKSCCFTGP